MHLANEWYWLTYVLNAFYLILVANILGLL